MTLAIVPRSSFTTAHSGPTLALRGVEVGVGNIPRAISKGQGCCQRKLRKCVCGRGRVDVGTGPMCFGLY